MPSTCARVIRRRSAVLSSGYSGNHSTTGWLSDLMAPSPTAIPTRALTTLLVTERRSWMVLGPMVTRPSGAPQRSSNPSKYSS